MLKRPRCDCRHRERQVCDVCQGVDPANPGKDVEPRLELVPLTMKEANAFVAALHRHSPPVRGCICVVGVARGDAIAGVAIVGRPVARQLADQWTAEVTRCCTDGTPHVASKLYAACWRAARALGYRRLVTYTRLEEGGASLRAAGFTVVAQVKAESWSRRERPRVDVAIVAKQRWELAV